MAANFIEQEELFQGNEQEQVQDVATPPVDSTKVDNVETPEPPKVEDDVPEKYKGKSPAEIIKMHQEAEKLIGRQEIGRAHV